MNLISLFVQNPIFMQKSPRLLFPLTRLYCTGGGNSHLTGNQDQWNQLEQTGRYYRSIPLRKLEISYTRSSGPGGQHVNKSNTKVQLRFRVDECDWIKANIRERLFLAQKHRIHNGYFVIRSERTRSQTLNTNDCLDKLMDAIRQCEKQLADEAIAQPTREDLEKMRKRQEQVDRWRVAAKRRHSENKRERRTDDVT